LNPRLAILDFERATMNALRHEFTNIILKGCWFHFKQAIFKKICNLGLRGLYNSPDQKQWFQKFGALALMPMSYINRALIHIRDEMPNDRKCQKLFNYFIRQWINSKNRFLTVFNLLYLIISFIIDTSPSVWNHYTTTDNIRTNNHIEGFNSKLNKKIRKHPSIYEFIECIKSIENQSLITKEKADHGQDVRARKSVNDRAHDEKILECQRGLVSGIVFQVSLFFMINFNFSYDN
jgi:hypothetical protein